MTQFKCEFCGNIYELDKMVTVPINTSDETTVGRAHICEECHKAHFTTMSLVECAWCGEYVDESDLKEVYDGDEGRDVKVCKNCTRDLLVHENTCVCCGEVIPEGRQVCLQCDLETRYGSEPTIENRDAPVDTGTLKHPFDIHKIIDDAMEKRDRTVSIYIGEAGVSVSVYPVDHDKVQWIYREDDCCLFRFECSNCGADYEFETTYCPSCGELMHGVRKEENDGETS